MKDPVLTRDLLQREFIDLTQAEQRHVQNRIEAVYQEVLAVRRDLFMMREMKDESP